MNAVVMVEGWLEGGTDGARSALETFWYRASLDASLSQNQRNLLDRILDSWANQVWTGLVSQSLTPIRPIRSIHCGTWSMHSRTHELTADHLMASACLPTVFQAVEIDIVLVQINSLERRQTPRTAREIHDRLNEIVINSNLLLGSRDRPDPTMLDSDSFGH